eukprot:3640498-Rhodomonas_salina.9
MSVDIVEVSQVSETRCRLATCVVRSAQHCPNGVRRSQDNLITMNALFSTQVASPLDHAMLQSCAV